MPEPSAGDVFAQLVGAAPTEPPVPSPRTPAPNPAQGSSGLGNPIPARNAHITRFIEWAQEQRPRGMWVDEHDNRH